LRHGKALLPTTHYTDKVANGNGNTMPYSEWLEVGIACEDDLPEILGLCLTTCYGNGYEGWGQETAIWAGTAFTDNEMRP
jgi:hypothetical protein